MKKKKRNSLTLLFEAKCVSVGLLTVVQCGKTKFIVSPHEHMEFAAVQLVKLMNAIWKSEGNIVVFVGLVCSFPLINFPGLSGMEVSVNECVSLGSHVISHVLSEEGAVALKACKDISAFLDSHNKDRSASRRLLSSSLSAVCAASFLLGGGCDEILLFPSGLLQLPRCCARLILDKETCRFRISSSVSSSLGPSMLATTLQNAGRALASLRRHSWILTSVANLLTNDDRLSKTIEIRLGPGLSQQTMLNDFLSSIQ